jgi:hypothetical protein
MTGIETARETMTAYLEAPIARGAVTPDAATTMRRILEAFLAGDAPRRGAKERTQ